MRARIAQLQLVADRRRARVRQREDVVREWWGGEGEPATVPEWPDDSLGHRLLSDWLMVAALGAPPLEQARVPDPAVVRSDPLQWEVAVRVLLRAVAVDGLGVDDPGVAALLSALAPVVAAELEAEEGVDQLDWGEGSVAFPEEGGPAFLIGCCALVHATWTLAAAEPLAVVALLLDDAVGGQGRVVAEVLVRAMSQHFACEGASDVELLERLGPGTSGDPLRDLVSAGLTAPRDALRAGLVVLGRLAGVCMTGASSVLGAGATEPGPA